jgi:hypothetical protein
MCLLKREQTHLQRRRVSRLGAAYREAACAWSSLSYRSDGVDSEIKRSLSRHVDDGELGGTGRSSGYGVTLRKEAP